MVSIELQFFFEKYKEFLSYESVVSLLKGREYRVIQFFYQLFMEISKKEIDEKRVETIKTKLESLIEEYKKENAVSAIEIDCEKPNLSRVETIINGALSGAFIAMIEATEQYMQWRKALPEEAIQEIFLKNLQDRQKYYFEDELQELNNELITRSVHKSYMLRQTLIEFYNAISHLSAVYYSLSPVQDNITRAIAHFQRGALDSYKAIVKDFCLLANGEQIDDNIIKMLKNIRAVECSHIGNKQKQEVIQHYKNATKNIIDSLPQV